MTNKQTTTKKQQQQKTVIDVKNCSWQLKVLFNMLITYKHVERKLECIKNNIQVLIFEKLNLESGTYHFGMFDLTVISGGVDKNHFDKKQFGLDYPELLAKYTSVETHQTEHFKLYNVNPDIYEM